MAADHDADLLTLADGKSFDDAKWPSLVDEVSSRIEKIAFNDFPPVKIPLHETVRTFPTDEPNPARASPDDLEPPAKKTKIEDADEVNATQEAEAQDGDEAEGANSNGGEFTNNLNPPPSTLPPQLLTLLQTIQATLKANFPTSPPHTAQRLAELVLFPNRHYRSLPAYLRSLDRIVTVASPTSTFPLPAGTYGNPDTNALFNGTMREESDRTFIGGAELTPIPWVRNSNPVSPPLHPSAGDLHTESTSMIDGPNGTGSVETVTVSVNGISSTVRASQAAAEQLPQVLTQGELIRQEQEAGITPVARVQGTNHMDRGIGTTDEADEEQNEEEVVHARGPSVIGMEDMGPQAPGSGLEKGIEIDGPLGSTKHEPSDGVDAGPRPNSDHVTADPDGVPEGEQNTEDAGVERGIDAVDGSTR